MKLKVYYQNELLGFIDKINEQQWNFISEKPELSKNCLSKNLVKIILIIFYRKRTSVNFSQTLLVVKYPIHGHYCLTLDVNLLAHLL